MPADSTGVLNFERNVNSLDWIEILTRMGQSATSDIAREKLLNLSSCRSESEALDSVENIFGAAEILSLGVRPHMSSLNLFPTWISRLRKKAQLKILEIRDVRHFCVETYALQEVLQEIETPWSQKLRQSLMEAERPISAIDQILTPGGEIRSDASQRLSELFSEKERLARDVQGHLDRLVHDHQMENLLQEKFVTTREGRWVLPIKSGMQHFMPGVIHGTSQTKQTVFMEPEKIIPLNNRLRQIEVDIEEEIERLLVELSLFLTSLAPDFETTRNFLEICDFQLAQAQFCTQIECARFEFSTSEVNLVGIKHPILALSGKPVVSNSVHLNSKKSILLLSGPNAGGKTVLLKSIGLAAQMARCGLPICAEEGSRIPFFKKIMIGIGDSQNVDENLSTFAAHLHILQKSTELRGYDQLILIDEICGSTDPEEGSALARSFIESFAAQKVFAVVTSHLGPLKSGWGPEDVILNGSLEYDPKSGRPTYQFLSGIAGDSLALQTARRVGVDPRIIDRALECLSPSTRARLDSLDEIERLKHDLSEMQRQLKSEMKKANEQKLRYENLIRDFESQKQGALEKTLKKAEKRVEEVIAQVRVDDTFKKHRQLQEIKYQLPEIVKAKPSSTLGNSSIESSEDFAKKFPPGTKVFVASLGKDGIIQSVPNTKGEVLVLANSIRLQLPWQELKPPTKSINPTGQILRETSSFVSSIAVEDRTLDLRGKTVEEALEIIESVLDRAQRSREERIKIIHGHGTEALKKAIRSHLSRSTYVKKWKSGGLEGGGDGTTWAEIMFE
ncbi:MAG: Smr/MutS family protein [Bdellovibrionaceae bacterium]|nr:Smr/MutS family protein [Pseudobdellovibrionaceae bacterium]